MIDRVNATLGGVVAVLAYVLGDNWALFAFFLLFNIGDWITGWMKSRIAGKENSQKGLNGIIKKCGYWLMILLSFAASAWFVDIGEVLHIDLQITKLLGWFVLASLTVNEFRSILENFVECGYDVPKILVEGLEVANKTFNKEDEK